MKNFTCLFLLFIACIAFKAEDINVSINDFKPVFGKWQGALTYLDYKSGKPFSMPANVTITENTTNNTQLILSYDYPHEPKANSNDTLTIGHTMLDKAKVVSKKTLPNNTVEIITEIKGKDGNDNKSAILKHTYIIGKNVFSMQKDVQFDGDTAWIQRDIYSFVK